MESSYWAENIGETFNHIAVSPVMRERKSIDLPRLMFPC